MCLLWTLGLILVKNKNIWKWREMIMFKKWSDRKDQNKSYSRYNSCLCLAWSKRRGRISVVLLRFIHTVGGCSDWFSWSQKRGEHFCWFWCFFTNTTFVKHLILKWREQRNHHTDFLLYFLDSLWKYIWKERVWRNNVLLSLLEYLSQIHEPLSPETQCQSSYRWCRCSPVFICLNGQSWSQRREVTNTRRFTVRTDNFTVTSFSLCVF